MPNDPEEFRLETVYYRVYPQKDLHGNYVPVVTTWIYLGYVHRPGVSCDTCERPEHFWGFQEVDYEVDLRRRDSWTAPRNFFARSKDAVREMLTWDELIQELSQMNVNEQ